MIDGTSREIGYFYAGKSPERKIIGVRTDFRGAGESEGAVIDAMIKCSRDWIAGSREEVLGDHHRLAWSIGLAPFLENIALLCLHSTKAATLSGPG